MEVCVSACQSDLFVGVGVCVVYGVWFVFVLGAVWCLVCSSSCVWFVDAYVVIIFVCVEGRS